VAAMRGTTIIIIIVEKNRKFNLKVRRLCPLVLQAGNNVETWKSEVGKQITNGLLLVCSGERS
jgi:hypothetical protein